MSNTLFINPAFKSIIPPLTHDEYQGLEQSLINEGCRDALVVWQNTIVDGHNRYEICKKHNIEFRTIEKHFSDEYDAIDWIIDNQKHRRNLSPAQKIELAFIKHENTAKRAKERQAKGHFNAPQYKENPVSANLHELEEPIDTATEIAKDADVSRRTVYMAKAIKETAPDVWQECLDGQKSINEGYKEIKKAEKRAEIQDKNDALKEKETKPITDDFDVIVIDPPWPMQKIERDVRTNQSKYLDYPTMTIDEIKNIHIPSAVNCHLFLWTTQKFLPTAFELLEHWGFKYVFTMVWHKNGGIQPYNLPQYNCEFVLYGKKGNPIFVDTKAFNTCFYAERGKHSEKPEAFYDVIRRVTSGHRLDMFSRRQINGFVSWGNEITDVAV